MNFFSLLKRILTYPLYQEANSSLTCQQPKVQSNETIENPEKQQESNAQNTNDPQAIENENKCESRWIWIGEFVELGARAW